MLLVPPEPLPLQADPPPFSVPQVEVEVESMDKAGNFIGWLHVDGANLSVLLVEHALSKVHFTAERSAYYKPLLSAEETAKQKKEKVLVWNWARLWRRQGPFRSLGLLLAFLCQNTTAPTWGTERFRHPPPEGPWSVLISDPTSGATRDQGKGCQLRCPQLLACSGGAEPRLEGDLAAMRGTMRGAPGEQETGELSLHQPQPSFGALRVTGKPTAHSDLPSQGPAGRPISEATPGDA